MDLPEPGGPITSWDKCQKVHKSDLKGVGGHTCAKGMIYGRDARIARSSGGEFGGMTGIKEAYRSENITRLC